MKFFSKLLSLLLAVAVIISAPLSVMAEETGAQDSGSGKTSLEMTEIDPSRMNVPKTGTVKETVILAAVCIVSVIALIFLIIMRKKRKEREEEE